MAKKRLCLFSSLLLVTAASSGVQGPQGVNIWRLEKSRGSLSEHGFIIQDHSQIPLAGSISEFRPQWFEQPLDHFSVENQHTFRQRYWVNDRHYKPNMNAPVFVIDGGETTGEERLQFLDTGIAEILSKATGGVGVLLEHRYYGESIPVDNFSTDALRWLNNEQAAADSANFMANIKFDGIEEDLTAPGTPWIYYGGSYAGARAAHMRVLYPDLVYGAIASSAVTHASLTNWEYMEVIRLAAERKCSLHLEHAISTIDTILDHPVLAPIIKALFGLMDLKHDEDFVALLARPLEAWQDRIWDPKFNSPEFEEFCAALQKPLGHLQMAVADLPFNHTSRVVEVSDDLFIDFSILNYAKWIREVACRIQMSSGK